MREVGPRDGLQAEAPVPVSERARLVTTLAGAGLTEIEVAAFVSPRAVPSTAGAASVFAAVGALPGVRRWALVPNVRGAEMALEAGADALTVTVSASETYSARNVHMAVAESVAEAGRICAMADR